MDFRKHKARKPSWGAGWSLKGGRPSNVAEELVAHGEGKASMSCLEYPGQS